MEGQGVSPDFIVLFFITVILIVTIHLLIIFVVFPTMLPPATPEQWQGYLSIINNTTLT
jgi:hypothetical protein